MAINKKVNVRVNWDGQQATQGQRQLNRNIDTTRAKTKRLTQESKAMLSKMKANWMALAAVVAGMVITFKKVIGVAAEQEQQEIRLAEAMKQAGTYTEKAYKHNLKYAASLQKLTDYGDEEILTVQRMLTNFGIEGEMLDKLTKSTLDLAAAKEMDLRSASDLVAKSVGSTTNALTRYGIEVKGAVGSTERMQMAVDNIARIFGGAAAAKAKTFTGQMRQMKNAIGDAAEKIGQSLFPVLLPMAQQLKRAAEAFQKLPGHIRTTAGLLAILGPAIIGITVTLGPLAGAIGAVAAGAMVLSIEIVNLKKAYDHLKTVKKQLNVQRAFDVQQTAKDIKSLKKEIKTRRYLGKYQELNKKQLKDRRKQLKESIKEMADYNKANSKFVKNSKDALSDLTSNLTGSIKKILNASKVATKKTKELSKEQKEALLASYTGTELDKRITQEIQSYEKLKKAFRGNREAIEAIERQHQKNLEQIHVDHGKKQKAAADKVSAAHDAAAEKVKQSWLSAFGFISDRVSQFQSIADSVHNTTVSNIENELDARLNAIDETNTAQEEYNKYTRQLEEDAFKRRQKNADETYKDRKEDLEDELADLQKKLAAETDAEERKRLEKEIARKKEDIQKNEAWLKTQKLRFEEEKTQKELAEKAKKRDAEIADKKAKVEKEANYKIAKANREKTVFDIISQSVIAAAQGIRASVQALPNYILSGIILGTTAVQVGAILGQLGALPPLPEMRRGGLIQGDKHDQGGVNINAEGGEYVMPREATLRYFPILEDMRALQYATRQNNINNYRTSSRTQTIHQTFHFEKLADTIEDFDDFQEKMTQWQRQNGIISTED